MSKRTSGKTTKSGLAAVGLVLATAAVTGTAGPAAAAQNPTGHDQLRFTRVPSDLTVRASDSAGAIVRYLTPMAWDRATATNAPVSCTPPSGSTFPVGRTEVVCTADEAGLASASRSFRVTVRPAPTGLTADRSRLTFSTMAGATRTQAVTVTNRGPNAAPIGPVRITGPDARAFTATDDCGDTLPDGATCTFTVTYRPSSYGHRWTRPQSARLVLGDHATVALVGTTNRRTGTGAVMQNQPRRQELGQHGRGRD